MTVRTYGVHAENAARALGALVCDDTIPTDIDAANRMLHCREAAVDALRQRLFDLGQDGAYPPPRRGSAAPVKPSLVGLDTRLAALVYDIAFSLPALPRHGDAAPLDYLASAASDPTVETWRTAAVELLSASHALSAAEEQPWRTEPAAGWWVLRDIAVALEALVVLDSRLEEVGLLVEHQHGDLGLGLDEKRMVLSQAARVATWHATSCSADRASPRRESRPNSTLVQPLSMVNRPSDLAAAQFRLSRFLRPTSAKDAFHTGQPEVSADCARHIVNSQLWLCRSFAKAATRSPETAALVSFFLDRGDVLECLQPQLRHLVDLRVERGPDMRRYWQQVELTTAVTRMEGRGAPLTLEETQLVELAEATHAATHNLAKGLRRELLRQDSNLVDAHPRHADGPARVGRRSKLEATVTDLVNLPAPPKCSTRSNAPLQRAALQQILDQEPSTPPRALTPYPVPRGAATPAFR
jgi:hypothetical protein